jgi:hypothetical protein
MLSVSIKPIVANFVMLNVVTLNAVVPNGVTLNVVRLSVIWLSVVAPHSSLINLHLLKKEKKIHFYQTLSC